MDTSVGIKGFSGLQHSQKSVPGARVPCVVGKGVPNGQNF